MKTKFFFSSFISILFFCVIQTTNSQTISIDSTFTEDGEIFPFDTTQAIYGLSIQSGSVTLFSDTSLVRIILVDTLYNEYMVYEAYPLIVTDSNFSINDVCDETCYLNGLHPFSIELQVVDAEVLISNIYTDDAYVNNCDSLQLLAKRTIEWNKVSIMNTNLQDRFLWGADTTSVSLLSYSEKKEKYGHKYNTFGLDYYSGGYFSYSFPEEPYPEDNSGFTTYFSWEDRHSANVQGSDYYSETKGWMTPLKRQALLCKNTCWIFGTIGALEACINLYFNLDQLTNNIHVNAIMSEQHVLSCNVSKNKCEDGLSSYVHNFIDDPGVEDEVCIPNQQNGNTGVIQCEDLERCTNPTYIISSSGRRIVPQTWSDIKENLIKYGPAPIMKTWKYQGKTYRHIMALMGFRVTQDGDTINRGRNLTPVVLDASSAWLGGTWFQFKDSDDVKFYWEEMKLPPNYPRISDFEPFTELEQHGEQDLIRMCLDLDEDGYHNWGVEPKPSSGCPSCPNKIDSDDSNGRLGPFDDNYNSISVAPQVEVYNENLQIELDREKIYAFPTQTDVLSFRIDNPGDAQLNLKRDFACLTIEGLEQGQYTINPWPLDEIPMFGSTYFGIELDISNQEAAFTVIINIDEPDIDPFCFDVVMVDCGVPGDPFPVVSDTWSDFKVFSGEVVVGDEVVLEILGKVAFGPYATLKIEEGGKVILDGGILTKACDELWPGVDVYGHSTHSQGDEEYHGVLEIKNGGLIEFAEIGAETAISYPEHNGYTGGIIKANGAVFKNNVVDVFLRPFQNTHPITGIPWDNLCGFTDCDFLTDEELYNLGPEFHPDAHMKLFEVDGVHITNCEFRNYIDEVTLSEELGSGIFSLDAEYFVQVSCLESDPATGECLQWNESLFENLDYGIYATNSRLNIAPTVNRIKFDKNYTGIYLSETPLATITLCEFDVKKVEVVTQDNDRYGGIYINNNCQGFTVEENYLYNSDAIPMGGDKNTIGIAVCNSGGVTNELYNNKLEYLNVGILAQELNRSSDGSQGLEIKCNDFIDCEYDIAVTKSDQYAEGLGIRYNQGEPIAEVEAPANCTFSYLWLHETSDYHNECEDIIYWYPFNDGGFNVKPIEYSDPQVNPQYDPDLTDQYNKEEFCPSSFASSTGIDEEKEIMSSFGQKADSIQNLLSLLVDGGDTEVLDNEVQTSLPEEALELRNNLLSESPYLTDTVMVSATNRENVLTPEMVTEILAANPQAAKSDTVQNALDGRIEQLTDEQRIEIDQGWFEFGAKESLEAKHSKYISTRSHALYNIIRFYRNDTISVSPIDSIIQMYDNEDQLWAKYTLVSEYFYKNDSDNVVNVLEDIPVEFSLTPSQSIQHELYEDYFDKMTQLRSEGKTIFEMDSSDLVELYSIYNNASGSLKAMVRNLLVATDTLNYREPYVLPDPLKTGKIRRIRIKKNYDYNSFDIYPNPANNYVVIDYSSTGFVEDGYIAFIDCNGKTIRSIPIKENHDFLIVPIEDLQNGLYICKFVINNNTIQTQKLIVTH